MTNLVTTEAIDTMLKDATDRELEHFAAVEVPALNWHSLSEEQQRSQRARNELARRARLAREQAQAAQVQQDVQQRRDEQNAATVEQFKQQARAVFPGTLAEFDAAWPDLKKAWQIQQTLNGMSAVERKAASNIYTQLD